MAKGLIHKDQFTKESKLIQLHGHCQQKAVGSLADSVAVLSLPENYKVETIPSGCCGMAGSFGYEKEHYDVSMQIGELVLFPAIRKQSVETIIAAPEPVADIRLKMELLKKLCILLKFYTMLYCDLNF